MAMLVRDTAKVYLLVVLWLISYSGSCGGTLRENVNAFTSEDTRRPEVRIPHGKVKGINMVTHHGRNIFGFKGIPFAQPPVGGLRFERPIAAKPWNGTLDAGNDPARCPQVEKGVVIGDEDCLYLNVYTPQLPSSENSTLLPVMIYVFGGRFKTGPTLSTHFGPYFLLDKDVVLLVANYRLGVLGFFSTGDEEAPGNYAMKDLVQALEWNRDNIRYFGGDPDQVTLAGGSSGAMIVELLMLSNSTNGLFHRYITESGTSLVFDFQQPRETFAKNAARLGKHLGCPTNASSSVLVECLKGIAASKLVNAEAPFHVWEGLPATIWGPTIEPDTKGAFLTKTPANLIAAGEIRDLPWLSGLTQEEGISFYAMVYKRADIFQSFLDNIDVVLPSLLRYNDLVDDVTAYTNALKSYYLNDLTADKRLLLKNATQLIGDAVFNYPFFNVIQKRLVYTKSPQYSCILKYKNTLSHSYRLTGGTLVDWGAVHGDIKIYLFQQPRGFLGPPEYTMNESDRKMVDLMVQIWTSFVINGKPTTSDPNHGIIWEPYSSRKNYLSIGSNSNVTIDVEYDLFKGRMKFWEELNANTTWK